MQFEKVTVDQCILEVLSNGALASGILITKHWQHQQIKDIQSDYL